MKKTIKILSAILSVIMMLAVVPFSTVAATTDVEEWEDGTLLMKKDVLFNTSVEEKVEGLEVSEIAATATNVTKDEDCDSFTNNATTSAWLPLGGISTNLELKENSRYTVEMTVNFAGSGRALIGLDGSDMSKMHAIFFNQTGLRSIYGIDSPSGSSKRLDKYTADKKTCPTTNDSQNHVLQFEINGNVISVYIDGTKYGTIDFGESTASTTAPAGLNSPLSIAITALPSNSIDANKTIIQVKDVSIYAGNTISSPVEETLTGSWEDGTLLMKKDVLFNTSVEEKVEGLEVSEIAATATNVTKATDGGSFTANTSIKAVLTPLSGISTNLKLDENSKYTIEMTMNFADSGRAVIGFDGDDMSMMHGIYFNKTSLRTNYSLTSAVTNTLDKYTISKTSFTSTNDKNDHLLRFEINGNVISVYIDGTKYGTIDFGESTASTTAPAGLNSPLSIAVAALPAAEVDAGATLIQVKDVSIYAGNVAGPKVSFEDENGNSLGVLPVEIGDVITEFPEVDAPEGKVVKWFHKGTNIIVSTPYTVPTASVVLVAKVIDTSEIKVAGMQYTAVSNSNTQSIRFVATIHTLQAEETGFVVTAKYMESGILKEKEFKVSSKTVYTAITANESGTVKSVTAGELGGTYLVAISVDDVPTNIGQIDFYVTALLKISDTRTVESAQVSFSMKDGAVLKNATPLT